MYSAIKLQGKRLYKLARQGKVVERASREVTVHWIEGLVILGEEVRFDISCSRGTYIRTLCADIGDRLGVGAHCHGLERLICGPFRIEQAVTMTDLATAVAEGRQDELFYDMDAVVQHLPTLRIRPESVEKACRGVALGNRDFDWPGASFSKGDLFRMTAPEIGLLGLARALLHGQRDGKVFWQIPVFKVEKVFVRSAEEKKKDFTTV